MIYNSAVHVSQPTHLVRTCQPLEVLSEPSRQVIHGKEAQPLLGRVLNRPSASHQLTTRRSDASERSSDSRHALPAMRRQPETSCNLMVAIGSVGKLWHAAAARSASRHPGSEMELRGPGRSRARGSRERTDWRLSIDSSLLPMPSGALVIRFSIRIHVVGYR